VTSDETPELTGQLNRSNGSFELVMSPVLLGLLGWWLDARVFHTTPWLTVIFAVVALAGTVVKMYYGYTTRMAELAEQSPLRRAERKAAAQAAPRSGADEGSAAA